MLEKRKYFISTQDQYANCSLQSNSFLYIYKHDYPEIIVKFPSPKKTVVGYKFTQVQITYHPFYDIDSYDSFHAVNRSQAYLSISNKKDLTSKIQKIFFPYQGELILNKQSEVLNQFLKREFIRLLHNAPKQPKIIKNHQGDFQIKATDGFLIILNEWLNSNFINAMFLINQKHEKSFKAFDCGFIQLEVLKTSDGNMKIQFYRPSSLPPIINRETANKKFFFEFQSSILPDEKEDYNDIQKLGFVMPKPLSTNEFFFECLIMMFAEFKQLEQAKLQKKAKQKQKLRVRQSLLANSTNLGKASLVINGLNRIGEPQTNIVKQDPLDLKLAQILRKKKIPESTLKRQTTHNFSYETHVDNPDASELKKRRESMASDSPQKKEEQLQEVSEKPNLKKQNENLQNVKAIHSFVSELIDDDFEANQKRRFITRVQYDKIIRANEKVIDKKQEKAQKLNLAKDHSFASHQNLKPKIKGNREKVYIGMKKTESKNIKPKAKETFVFDFFSVEQDIVLEQKTNDQDQIAQIQQKQKPIFDIWNGQINPFNQKEPNFQGLEDLSVINRKITNYKDDLKDLNSGFFIQGQNSNLEDTVDYQNCNMLEEIPNQNFKQHSSQQQ